MRQEYRGFTLLELLAAIAIFAVMALMAYGGLAAVLKARASVEGSLARTAEIQKAIYRLQSDIEQVRARAVRDEFGDEQPAFISREEDLEDARVEFTRGGWRNPRLQPRSVFERVAYGLEDGKLIRYSWITLDRAQEDSLVEVPLLDAVESLSWRFLDTQLEWHDYWPPRNRTESQAERVPLAVELQLETKDWGEIRYLFRIVTTGKQIQGLGDASGGGGGTAKDGVDPGESAGDAT